MAKPKNDFLDKFENTKEYKQYHAFYKRTLKEQWNDIIYSGLINSVYNRFASILSAKKKKSEDTTTEEAVAIAVAGTTAKLQLYFQSKVTKKMKAFKSYKNVPRNTDLYNFHLAMESSADELRNYLSQYDIKPPKFMLTSKLYRSELKKRARDLWKGMDEFTSKRFASTLIKGMEAGDTKTQLVNRMLKTGDKLSIVRAKRIVQTETNAAANYMRNAVGISNGSKIKRFQAILDDRTSHICISLNGSVISIDREFEGTFNNVYYSGNYPPMHVNCLHKETKIMTRSGWKLINCVEVGEECLSLNPNTGETEYIPVAKKIDGGFREKLLRLKTNDYDICVTDDHQMVYWDVEYKFCDAKKLKNKIGFIPTSKTSDVLSSNEYIGNINEEYIDYNDNVYCVELERNHTLYAMYNGKCSWTGNCRSYVVYEYDIDYWLNKYLAIGLVVGNDYNKKKKGNLDFYPSEKINGFTNPNAVWNGGEANKLVGKDSKVTMYHENLSRAGFTYFKNVIKQKDFEEKVTADDYDNPIEKEIYEARRNLTDLGFIQLQYFLNDYKETGMIKIKKRNKSI